MKLWRVARASCCLLLLCGCNGARDAADAGQGMVTGGSMVRLPDLGGVTELFGQMTKDGGKETKAAPANNRFQRPTNPALLAQRAKLQSLRSSTILGRSRALMHQADFDQLKRAARGLPPKGGTPAPKASAAAPAD